VLKLPNQMSRWSQVYSTSASAADHLRGIRLSKTAMVGRENHNKSLVSTRECNIACRCAPDCPLSIGDLPRHVVSMWIHVKAESIIHRLPGRNQPARPERPRGDVFRIDVMDAEESSSLASRGMLNWCFAPVTIVMITVAMLRSTDPRLDGAWTDGSSVQSGK